MKCVICKQGETRASFSTVTLEKAATVLVVKSVPAQVCENCGEAYVDRQTTASLLKTAEDIAKAGVRVDIREYLAA